jgi:hypothetical protein
MNGCEILTQIPSPPPGKVPRPFLTPNQKATNTSPYRLSSYPKPFPTLMPFSEILLQILLTLRNSGHISNCCLALLLAVVELVPGPGPFFRLAAVTLNKPFYFRRLCLKSFGLTS